MNESNTYQQDLEKVVAEQAVHLVNARKTISNLIDSADNFRVATDRLAESNNILQAQILDLEKRLDKRTDDVEGMEKLLKDSRVDASPDAEKMAKALEDLEHYIDEPEEKSKVIDLESRRKTPEKESTGIPIQVYSTTLDSSEDLEDFFKELGVPPPEELKELLAKDEPRCDCHKCVAARRKH